MRRVILDVASLSIKQQLPSPLLRELLGAHVDITFVTLGELIRWATLRQLGPTRRAELDGWLATRPTLPDTDEDCPASGAKSPRTRPDAVVPAHRTTRIAAACLAYDRPLATLNVKDFRDLAEHEGLTLLGT